MEPTEAPRARPTPAERLRDLAATFAALAGTRVELAIVELREDAERRKELAILAATAGVFLGLAALLFALFIVIVFWDSHRVAAAAAVTALYLAAGLAAFARLQRRRREYPAPFRATLAELAQDLEALRGARE